jgi:hypothetical protein
MLLSDSNETADSSRVAHFRHNMTSYGPQICLPFCLTVNHNNKQSRIMSTHWTTFERPDRDDAQSRKKLSDYFELAERHRHVHFSEGLSELEDRASGLSPSPDLDRQTVFASEVQRHADAIRTNGATGEDAYLDLRHRTQLLWCCCFTDVAACDEIADLLQETEGWKARADFIVMLSAVRNALGPSFFPAAATVSSDPERTAQSRLKTRWQDEAVVLSFEQTDYATPKAQIAWIAKLGRDCLHDYVLNFEWEAEPPALLQAVIDHPDCDSATALWLYARCNAQLAAPDELAGKASNRAIRILTKNIRTRLKSGGYGPSQFSKTDASQCQGCTTGCRQNTKGEFKRTDAEDSICRQHPVEHHNPRYSYCGISRSFLQPFRDWSMIRVVSSN